MKFLDMQTVEERIRTEYMEMPGLQLTFWQAQRLWNLSEEGCERALNSLIASGFLVRTSDGCYARPHAGWATRGFARLPVLRNRVAR